MNLLTRILPSKQFILCVSTDMPSKKKVWKQKNIKQVDLVRLLQLEGVEITRETLVKIESGVQHIKASQLRGIRDALGTTYDELLK